MLLEGSRNALQPELMASDTPILPAALLSLDMMPHSLSLHLGQPSSNLSHRLFPWGRSHYQHSFPGESDLYLLPIWQEGLWGKSLSRFQMV